MQIPILVEPIAGNGYRARGAEPFSLTGEGATPEAAVARLKEQLHARLRQGAVIVPLELTPEPHPLAQFAGMFKDDPYFEEVLQIMAENRQKMDRDPKIP